MAIRSPVRPMDASRIAEAYPNELLINYTTGEITIVTNDTANPIIIKHPGSLTVTMDDETILNKSALSGDITLNLPKNASSASQLQSARTISLSGDATGSVSFDGSANVDIATTLSSSGVTVGTYGPNADAAPAAGESFTVPAVTVDSKGRVTGASNKTITIPAAPTSVSGNAGSATQLSTAQTIDGVSFNGTAAITHYGTCSTAAATAAKTVSCTGFTLVTGAEITVKFTVTNTASNPTLNVNSTGDKSIYYRGAAITAGYLAANRTYTFRYNGSEYELVGDIDTDTTYSVATTGTNGLMSSGDKTKLDGIDSGATANSASTTTPKVAGTAAVGTETAYARGDHVHPAQTDITGNAATATKLASAVNIGLSSDVSGSVSFDGSKDATITATLSTSGVSAGTYGPTSNPSPTVGGTFTVPSVTVDTKGRVTSASNRTVNLPTQTTITGNAATASQLQTSRNIELNGAVSGNADFDGSSDITITTSMANNDLSVFVDSSWTGGNPYTKTVDVLELTPDHSPIMDIDLSGVAYDDVETYLTEYAKIYRAVSDVGTLTLYAVEAPTVDLTLIIRP